MSNRQLGWVGADDYFLQETNRQPLGIQWSSSRNPSASRIWKISGSFSFRLWLADRVSLTCPCCPKSPVATHIDTWFHHIFNVHFEIKPGVPKDHHHMDRDLFRLDPLTYFDFARQFQMYYLFSLYENISRLTAFMDDIKSNVFSALTDVILCVIKLAMCLIIVKHMHFSKILNHVSEHVFTYRRGNSLTPFLYWRFDQKGRHSSFQFSKRERRDNPTKNGWCSAIATAAPIFLDLYCHLAASLSFYIHVCASIYKDIEIIHPFTYQEHSRLHMFRTFITIICSQNISGKVN